MSTQLPNYSTPEVRPFPLLILEVVILVAATATSTFRVYFVHSTKIFHVTIRVLLINESIGNTVYIAVKMTSLVFQLTDLRWTSPEADRLIRSVYMALLIFTVANNVVILFERIYSTLRASRYESVANTPCLLVVNAIPWFIVVAHATLYATVLDASATILPYMCTVLLTTIGFVVIGVINKKRDETVAKSSGAPLMTSRPHTTLTERFQTRENLSVAKMMTWYMGFYFVSQLVQLFFVYLNFFVYPRGHEHHKLFSAFNDITQSVKLFTEPIVLFLSNSNFRKKYAYVRPTKEKYNRHKNEGQVYFETLKQQWN